MFIVYHLNDKMTIYYHLDPEEITLIKDVWGLENMVIDYIGYVYLDLGFVPEN